MDTEVPQQTVPPLTPESTAIPVEQSVPQTSMPMQSTLSQQTGEQVSPKNIHASSLWNKMLLFLLGFLILAGVAGGSYYLGVQRSASVYNMPTPTPIKVFPSPLPSVAPTASSQSAQLISAGGVLNLKAYTISVPTGWNVTHTIKPNFDEVAISKDGYTINIWEVAGDGGVCSYPDNNVTTGVTSGYFATFTQITDQNGAVYRRGLASVPAGSVGMKYSLCQLQQAVFRSITSYGSLFYNTPKNPTNTMLLQMDAIIATIKAQ